MTIERPQEVTLDTLGVYLQIYRTLILMFTPNLKKL